MPLFWFVPIIVPFFVFAGMQSIDHKSVRNIVLAFLGGLIGIVVGVLIWGEGVDYTSSTFSNSEVLFYAAIILGQSGVTFLFLLLLGKSNPDHERVTKE